MTPLDLLRAYALIGLPLGLVVGAGLGLVARREDGWGGYASFERRATRLGHVAAVMLPALSGLYSILLSGADVAASALAAGAVLWIAGGVLLPVALFAAAWRRRLVPVVPIPAMALVAGAAAFALAGLAS